MHHPGRLTLLALALLALTVGVPSASAEPAGPRLAVMTHGLGGSAIVAVGPDGERQTTLVPEFGGEHSNAHYPSGDRPAWSPDGTKLAFSGSFSEYSPSIFAGRPGAGRAKLLSRGAESELLSRGAESEPIFTADGKSVAFSVVRLVKGEFRRPAANDDDDYGVTVDWAVAKVPISGGRTGLVTRWRRHQRTIPTSFSPDGKFLAAERESVAGVDAVAVELKGGGIHLLARGAQEPVFSPDGLLVAFVRTSYRIGRFNLVPAVSRLYVMPAAGGRATVIARIKGGLAWPSWDPSGQRLAFTRGFDSSLGESEKPSEVMQINADGTCLSTVVRSTETVTYFGAAWRPGLGREAGPIACSKP